MTKKDCLKLIILFSSLSISNSKNYYKDPDEREKVIVGIAIGTLLFLHYGVCNLIIVVDYDFGDDNVRGENEGPSCLARLFFPLGIPVNLLAGWSPKKSIHWLLAFSSPFWAPFYLLLLPFYGLYHCLRAPEETGNMIGYGVGAIIGLPRTMFNIFYRMFNGCYEGYAAAHNRATSENSLVPSSVDIEQVAVRLTTSQGFQVIATQDLIISNEKLGQGGFGVVYKGSWMGVKVAVKQIADQNLPVDVLNDFKKEIEIHGRLRHPNIVVLYGVCLEQMKYAIVMELMIRGSLYNVLHSTENLPWTQRMNIAIDMAAGLLFLHGQNILHRDLKSLNILLDENGRAKISDFGLSKMKSHVTATITKNQPVGTPFWMAPELLAGNNGCTQQTDVYALGIVLWEVASRKFPYQDIDRAQVLRQVENGKREKIPSGTPAKFSQLISQCWAQRASDRPNAQYIFDELSVVQGKPGYI